jgi:Arc/MetJ-type ribon-helix-helix transcriptional regulator
VHVRTGSLKRITVALPEDLVLFADSQAKSRRLSPSQVLSSALVLVKEAEEERLAAEGYRFYAAEASEFAAASASAVAEAIDHVR